MNFLAMPTLKNERACLRRPISRWPLRSLKLTLESDRTGIARVGSRRFWAALITTSATPISFFSTTLGLRVFEAMAGSYRVRRLPAAPRFGDGLRAPRGPEPFARALFRLLP